MSEQAAINGHAAVEKLEVRKDDIELGGVFTSCEIIGIETVDTVVASDMICPVEDLMPELALKIFA